jgi:AraC family L-rhamnose operon regulatory protein RhaS
MKKRTKTQVSPKFQDGKDIYHADSCEALRKASLRREISLKAFVRGQYPGTPLANDILPGLRTVGYWNAAKEQSWGLNWHRNEGIEISFLLSGKLLFWTSSSFWEISAGDILACSPWQLHRIGNPNVEASTLLWFVIDSGSRNNHQIFRWPPWIVLSKQDLEEILSLLVYSETPTFPLPARLIASWKKLYGLLRDAKECPVSAVAILINEILFGLLQVLREAAKKSETPTKEKTPALKSVQRFFEELEAIPEQLAYPWTLREMAKLCRISESRFAQCCYQMTNLSPPHALNRLRIDKAKEMMQQDPELSVLQITLNCGFSSSQYFATIFRKWTGMSPTEFRRKILNQ